MIVADVPESFRRLYSSMWIVLDATEVQVEKPHLPGLQQVTFANDKNTNMYKVLIGISLSGIISFVSKLYAGSISDEELTHCSIIMDLLQLRR